MKVRELIEQLANLDQESDVWIPDHWPYTHQAALCTAIIDEGDGSILVAHVGEEDLDEDHQVGVKGTCGTLVYLNPHLTDEDEYLQPIACRVAIDEIYNND